MHGINLFSCSSGDNGVAGTMISEVETCEFAGRKLSLSSIGSSIKQSLSF